MVVAGMAACAANDRPQADPVDGSDAAVDVGADATTPAPGPDTGVVDAFGDRDAEMGGGLGLVVLPEPLTFPGGRGTTAEVVLRNDGPGSAGVSTIAFRTADDTRDHDDFRVEACGRPRCLLSFRLCDPFDPNCSGSFASYLVAYENPDRSARDDGILRVEVDGRGPVDVVVLASDAPCPSPTAVARLAGVGQVSVSAVLDGSSSDSGGDNLDVIFFFWRFLATPSGEEPPWVDQGTSLASFTPVAAGLHRVELKVTNECGLSSAAELRIEVTP